MSSNTNPASGLCLDLCLSSFPRMGGNSARKVFPGFGKLSDHQGTLAEMDVDFHLSALFFWLPGVLSVSIARKFLSTLYHL